MYKCTVENWLDLMRQFKYDVDSRPYGINIVGFRNKHGKPDQFCDTIAVYQNTPEKWEAHYFPATTRPGVPNLLKPVNPSGTAIVVPGQYLKVYALGEFKGYKALRQVGPLKVYRDNNRDSQFNENSGTIQTGLFGIHIHRAGWWSKIVGQHSAGCQVIQNRAAYAEFIALCEANAVEFGRNRFTYTLLEF